MKIILEFHKPDALVSKWWFVYRDSRLLTIRCLRTIRLSIWHWGDSSASGSGPKNSSYKGRKDERRIDKGYS